MYSILKQQLNNNKNKYIHNISPKNKVLNKYGKYSL